MHTKKKVREYSQARKQKQGLLSTKLYKELSEVKKLDKHISSFIKAVNKDEKLGEEELNEQIAFFEDELHAEAKELRKEIKQGINHLVKGLEKLTELKLAQEKATGKKHHLKEVFSHEKMLANALMRSLYAKIDSLEKAFNRIK